MDKILISCLNEVGIQVDDTKDDIDLREYNLDSFTFLTFIVAVEEEYGVMIPDEYLRYDNIKSLKGFENMLHELINEEKQST